MVRISALIAAFTALGFVLPVHAQEPIRVRKARKAVGAEIKERVQAAGLSYPPKEIYIRVFKGDDEVEVWGGNGKSDLVKIHTYRVCARSGELGPKRKQGDLQVPEGFYFIDRFNPVSSYHLSLGLNYPNASDRILGRKPLGGDIFIHGDCVTIGCVPLEDEIKTLYLLALDSARGKKMKVPVHVFPTRMDESGMKALKEIAEGDEELWAFWQNLQPGYAAFEKVRRVPRFSVDQKTGRYQLRR
jgi:murein L,D-transpeptidase YafK